MVNSYEVRQSLAEIIERQQWKHSWNHEKEVFQIFLPQTTEAVSVSIPKLLDRMKNENKEIEQVLAEVVEQINVFHQSIIRREQLKLVEQQHKIFPVMRSTSFPTEGKSGESLVYSEHTAESRIYYAIDLEKSYTLIDQAMLEESSWSIQELKEKSLFNLRGLENVAKLDTVANNHFYFIHTQDGYASSRILNQSLLAQYAAKVEGDFCLAIPHQDVLILADLRNEAGYDVLGQMTMHFYRNGEIPITALPFDYKNGLLEPIFILAKRK